VSCSPRTYATLKQIRSSSSSSSSASSSPGGSVDIYSTADRSTVVEPRPFVDNHRAHGSMLNSQFAWDPQSNYRISERAFAAPNIALAPASVTREVNKEQNETNSDRNVANNSASSNTENNFNPNSTTENYNFVSQPTVSLSQYPVYSHANTTASGLFNSYGPSPLGLPLLGPVGPGPVTTWSTATHPVQREVTSSYSPLGVIGPSTSRPGNPSIDADSRCGPPPSVYYYGLPSTTPPELSLPVPTYPTADPAAATPYPSTSSTLMY